MWIGCVGDDPASSSSSGGTDGGGGTDSGGPGNDGGSDGNTSSDTGADAPPARCDKTKPFAVVGRVPWVSDPQAELWGRLTTDELTMVLNCLPVGVDPATGAKLCITTRANREDPFPTPTTLIGVLGSIDGAMPSISDDLLTIVYQVGDGASGKLYRASRTLPTAEFTNPTELTGLRTTPAAVDGVSGGFLLPDGLTLYFDTYKSSGGPNPDIAHRRAVRSVGGEFSSSDLTAAGLTGAGVTLTPNELLLYDALATSSIQRFHRAAASDSWTPDGPLASVNAGDAGSKDIPTWISADDCVLYFWSLRASALPRMYIAQRGK